MINITIKLEYSVTQTAGLLGLSLIPGLNFLLLIIAIKERDL